jgi:hypothetical protein
MAYWLAQWPIGEGRAKRRKFGVKKYGEHGAYRLALQARQLALRALGASSSRRRAVT